MGFLTTTRPPLPLGSILQIAQCLSHTLFHVRKDIHGTNVKKTMKRFQKSGFPQRSPRANRAWVNFGGGGEEVILAMNPLYSVGFSQQITMYQQKDKWIT